MGPQSWLDEGPDAWTLRYLASQPLWLAVLAATAMAVMQLFDRAACQVCRASKPGKRIADDLRRRARRQRHAGVERKCMLTWARVVCAAAGRMPGSTASEVVPQPCGAARAEPALLGELARGRLIAAC